MVLPADHPLQDGKAVAVIEKIMIADTDHLLDSWLKTEILDGLNGSESEFLTRQRIMVNRGLLPYI